MPFTLVKLDDGLTIQLVWFQFVYDRLMMVLD